MPSNPEQNRKDVAAFVARDQERGIIRVTVRISEHRKKELQQICARWMLERLNQNLREKT